MSDPDVSIVVPVRDRPDLLTMVHETVARAGDVSREVVLVDNGTTDVRAKDLLARSPHRIVRAPIPFNFSRLVNRGAAVARGRVIVSLNNDVEARATGWLDALLAPLDDPGVAVSGALLETPDGCVQHCGIAIEAGVPTHIHAGLALGDLPGEIGAAVSEPPAVTGACMAVRRDAWVALRGMATPLATNYNDVDLCFRAWSAGWRVACVPIRGLVHHESSSRGTTSTPEVAADWLLFRSRWTAALKESPVGRGADLVSQPRDGHDGLKEDAP